MEGLTMAKGISCPECGSAEKIWLKGLVPTRKGQKQRYVCFTCGRSFYKPKPVVKVKKAKPSIKPSDMVEDE